MRFMKSKGFDFLVFDFCFGFLFDFALDFVLVLVFVFVFDLDFDLDLGLGLDLDLGLLFAVGNSNGFVNVLSDFKSGMFFEIVFPNS